MKRIKNIVGRAGCLLGLWLACTLAQAQSFTIAVSEGGTQKTVTAAGRYYPMTLTNSDGGYAGTHTLTVSTNAMDTTPAVGVPEVCTQVGPNCSSVGTCQSIPASMSVNFTEAQATLCLKMPSDVGSFSINVVDDGSATGTIALRTVPSYFDLAASSIVNRAELNRSSASCASNFTYLGEPLRVQFSLIARNEQGNTTVNYMGAELNAAAADTAHWINYDANGSMGLRFVGAGYPAGLGADPRISVSPSTPSWSNGQGSFQAEVTLSHNASGEGPYSNITIGIAPQDDDGVTLKIFNLDADSNGANERASVGTTTLRYGRLKIANAYGSDVLPLPVDVRAQAWNGSAFVDLPDDNCTPLDGGYFILAPVGSLPSPAAGTTSIVGTGTLNAGKGRIALTRLTTAPISGKVITAIKTAPALDTYLPGVGTGTFGVYRSGPVIYRRELHY